MKERTAVLEALRVPPLECRDVSCHPLGRMGFRCQVKSKEVQENCNQVVVQQLVETSAMFVVGVFFSPWFFLHPQNLMFFLCKIICAQYFYRQNRVPEGSTRQEKHFPRLHVAWHHR